ncbi:hypothetical protein CJU89_6769 [Yarrowia sp. B02]|nr:hypothetical protein CJU89_6769 [Yarrowia sp. B02]
MTFSVTRVAPLGPLEVVADNEQHKIFLYEGLEITMPPDHHVEQSDVQTSVLHLWIRWYEYTVCVMQRSRPHHEHGIFFNKDFHFFPQGNAFFALDNRENGSLYFADFSALRPRKFASTGRLGHNIGSYNGQIWWSGDNFIVTTFIDLQELDKVYYRPDRAFDGGSKAPFFSQSWPQGKSSSFSCGRITEGLEVVDLAARTVTLVQDPGDVADYWKEDSECHFHVGFQDGKFWAYAFPIETAKELGRRYAIGDEDEEGEGFDVF